MMSRAVVQTTLFLLLLWSHAQSTFNTPNRIQSITTQGFLQFVRSSAQFASSSMLLTSVFRPSRTLAAEGTLANNDDCICGVRQCTCAVKNDYVAPWYDPSNERIFDTLHGSFIPADSYKYLPKDLRDCRIVAVGEVHSNPVHHRVEFEVIKTLSAIRNASNVAIGLECFYRQHQKALDRFVFLHNDIAKLKYETNWDDTWGYDLNYYAKIFKYAAQNQVRLIGLNLPIQVAKLVSYSGYESLPGALKTVLPSVDLNDKVHREQFYASIQASFASHNFPDEKAIQNLYETQVLWDEYMAETASRYVEEYPNSTLLVIAGLNHVKGRSGIPNRISKRVGINPFVILPQAVDWSEETNLPIIESPLSATDADWVWYTQKELN